MIVIIINQQDSLWLLHDLRFTEPTVKLRNGYHITRQLSDRAGIMFYAWDYKARTPAAVRDKATEIANELLLNGAPEGIAIATGLKKARAFFAGGKKKNRKGE